MLIKGQTLTYDFFVASSVFFLATTILLFSIYYKFETIREAQEKGELTELLISASDVWFKEGYPKYWSIENVVEIGISNENQINTTKIRFMEEMGYEKFASILNLGNFDVNYLIYSQNGTLIYYFPSRSVENSKNILVFERTAIWNDSIVRVRTILWQRA